MKLKDLKCSVHKLDSNGKFYIDIVNIQNSPWIPYLKNKNTKHILDSFKATRANKDHPNDYSYPFDKFDKLVSSIKKHGYRNDFCNNPTFQDKFNGTNWPGGKKQIFINPNCEICDGHHRCAILYHIYGPEFSINVINGKIQNIPPLNN